MTRLQKTLAAVGLTFGSFLVLGVLCTGAAVIARLLFVDYYIIPQDGMYPTIAADSRALAWRNPYVSVSEIRRGEVVVLRQFKQGRPYKLIWRVIGLPGDSIQQMATGEMKVNGRILPLTHVRYEGDFEIFDESNVNSEYEVAYQKNRRSDIESSPAVEIGEGELFVVGDNRDNAYDSRAYGCVPFSWVVGRVFW